MSDVHRDVGDMTNAAFVDFDRKQVTLFNGHTMPLVKIIDEDGEDVDESCLDLLDEFAVIYGPYEGCLWAHTMRRGDREELQ